MPQVIFRPTYATRRDVKTALDIKLTADYDTHVDLALMEAADSVDALCRRRFYNVLTTQYWNWPNFQRAYPWRVWLDEREIADVSVTIPVVTSGGNTITASTIFWGPWNYSPPFTFLELDRSSSSTFGQGSTPQRDIAITALFGYWLKTRPGGSLAAAVSDTTGTTITITDSSLADVGDVLTVDSEQLLVTDTAMTTTGLTQSGAGAGTVSEADNQLTASGAGLHAGEIVQLDGERMYVSGLVGNVATVVRAYDGTVLASHSAATINALRSLTVVRGALGSTAATHSNAAALAAAVVPGLVRDLSLAEAVNSVLQKTTGYARTTGENMRIIPGGSLPDLRDRCYRTFGRKHRSKVI